jgi:hypothetical protein
MKPEAEFLDEIQKKVLRVFLLAIQSHPLQLCTEISISSNSRNLLQFLKCVTVHCNKEKNLIESFKIPSLFVPGIILRVLRPKVSVWIF